MRDVEAITAMLCYAMLCYAMLCYAMLCYAMLCFPIGHVTWAPTSSAQSKGQWFTDLTSGFWSFLG
jgi:hypothetical protein